MESPPIPIESSALVTSNNRLGADWAYLGGLILLGCFAWIPDSYFEMVGWPGILVWQIAFLTIGAGCCYRLRIFEQPFRRLGYGLDWAVLGLGLSLVLSSVAAQFPALAVQNSVLALFYGITLYSLRNTTLPWLRGKYLVQGLVAMGAIASIISLVLWHPTSAMWLSNEFGEAIRNRFPLGHHNFSGGFFVLIAPLAVGIAWRQTGWQRWLNGAASLSLILALYSSGSRGAWLGAVVVTLVFLGILLYRSRGKGSWRTWLVSLLILAVLGGGLLSNPRIRHLIDFQPTIQSTDPTIIRLSDGPTKDRFFMAQACLNILRAHPLLGVGPGNLGRVYDLYRPIEAGAGLDQVQQLHNLPLQLLAELGLVGGTAYLWGMVSLIRLWWRLHRQNGFLSRTPEQGGSDSVLVGAIGLSLLGYGISSLTDYQLENIPIAITLLGLIVLLIQLADPVQPSIDSQLQASEKSLGTYGLITSPSIQEFAVGAQGHSPRGMAPLRSASAPLHHSRFQLSPGLPLSSKSRRIASLLVLVALGLALQFWVRNTLAIALTAQGVQAIQNQNFTQADTQFYRAAKVAPWDPTPTALAAEQLVGLAPEIDTVRDQNTLLTEARKLYQQALKVAPNDLWFNSNLAVLARVDDPDLANIYASKTVRLAPRSRNYSYYLLGSTYLDQDQTEKAITAFALESLVNPNFPLLSLWDSPEMQEVRSQFFDRTLQNYATLLSALPEQSSQYQSLYWQSQMLRWWAGLSLTEPGVSPPETLHPLTQALLQADDDPTLALTNLNQCVAQDSSQENPCLLLRAWLQPETYLADYLNISPLSAEEKQQIETHIQTHRTLKPWLKSTKTVLPERERYGLALIYRNLYANRVIKMLRPTSLKTYALVDLLNLTPDMPREFPVLDHLLETIRSEQLGLPHPTLNHFQLTLPSP